MALIEPVSSLSIKRAVNLYTIILFLSFTTLLYWLASDRYEVFTGLHKDTAANTTKVVAFEINKTIKEKQRVIDLFIETSKKHLIDLLNNPEDSMLYQQLARQLKKYQPDSFLFTILDKQGNTVIGNNNEISAEFRHEDIQHYVNYGEQRVRLHTKGNMSYYDIISSFTIKGSTRFLLVSFNTDDISDLLTSMQSQNHNLVLVNKDTNKLIEVASQITMTDSSARKTVRMKGSDILRELSSTKVKATDWHVVDMYEEGFFSGYKNTIIKEYFIVFYIFAIIALFMRNILIKQDLKRTLAEKQLHENHNQIKDLNDQLELLSRTDSLTGLYNRRYFDEIVLQEWNRGLRTNNPLSCILLDIDNFKSYNDCYGHQAGDKCLKNISLLMKDTFRRAGDLVARYGGEEFIIIMSNTSSEDAKSAITHFQQELVKLRIPHKESAENNHVTISAGVVNQMPSHDESIDDFIRKADTALYQAKASGKNQWVMNEQDTRLINQEQCSIARKAG